MLKPLHRVFEIAEQHTLSEDERLDILRLAVEALCALEKRSELCDFTGRRWHSVLHIAGMAEWLGPLRHYSECAYEQTYGVRKREGRKLNAQPAGVAIQAEWRATTALCAAVSPSIQKCREAVANRQAAAHPAALQVDGMRLSLRERHTRALSPLDQEYLLLAIRQTQLAPLWAAYQKWCTTPIGRAAASTVRSEKVALPFPAWFTGFCNLSDAERAEWAPLVHRPVPEESTLFGRAEARGWTFYTTASDEKYCKTSVNDGVRSVEGGLSYVGTINRIEMVRFLKR